MNTLSRIESYDKAITEWSDSYNSGDDVESTRERTSRGLFREYPLLLSCCLCSGYTAEFLVRGACL